MPKIILIFCTALQFLIFSVELSAKNLEYKYIEYIKHSKFSYILINRIEIKSIFKKYDVELIFYDGWNPENNHGNQGIFVIKNGRITHKYSTGGCESVRVRHDSLLCTSLWREIGNTTSRLSDVLAGRQVVIGGDVEDADRGD